MADQLCTTAQVKVRIFPAGVTDAVDDTLISELIDEVSAFIQNYTGRKFVAEAAATYTFDTMVGYVLRVPRGIRSITTMGVASTSQPDAGGTYTTVAAADRLLRPLAVDLPEGWPATEVRISRGTLAGTIARFSRADNGCTITGNFGFATTPVDIQAVAIDAVVAAYASRANGASGVIGADGLPIPPWAGYFGKSSPQRSTLERYRYQSL